MDKVLPWIGQPLPAIPTDTLASLTTTLRGLFGHFGGDLQRFRAVGLHCKLSQVDKPSKGTSTSTSTTFTSTTSTSTTTTTTSTSTSTTSNHHHHQHQY